MDTEDTTGQIPKRFPTKNQLLALGEDMAKEFDGDAEQALRALNNVPRTEESLARFNNLKNQYLSLKKDEDAVNHPSHYTAYKGLEVIDLTEQMNFNRGNAVKYIARAGLKNPSKEVEDLEKAKWYIQREIDRVSANATTTAESTNLQYQRCPTCETSLDSMARDNGSTALSCHKGHGWMYTEGPAAGFWVFPK